MRRQVASSTKLSLLVRRQSASHTDIVRRWVLDVGLPAIVTISATDRDRSRACRSDGQFVRCIQQGFGHAVVTFQADVIVPAVCRRRQT